MLYKICIFTDFHRNPKIFQQVLSFGVLGLLISTSLIGSAVHITEGKTITLELALLFGLLCVPIYPAIAIGQQKLFNTSFSQVSSLLEGECLAATTTAFFLLDVFVRPRHNYAMELFILIIATHLVAGAVIGWIFGLVLRKLLGSFSEPPIVIMIIFFVPLSSYVSVYFLGFNENLAFIIQVITICKRRSSLRKDVDQFFIKLVTVAGTIFTDIILIYIGIFLAEELITERGQINIPFIMCMYIIVTCGRFFSYAVLSMILSKFDRGLSLSQMALAIWCGVPSIINIFMGLRLFYFYHPDLTYFGKSIPGNISGLVVLGYIINVWTTPLILTRLDHLPLARDVNMKICFQRIMDTRKFLFLKLKLDRMLSDAHWFMVKDATVLTHPYWKTTNTTAAVEDNFRFAVCNNCNLEFSVPPTYKEYQEMSREARRRVLNAKKNFYVKQHEHGMLSEESCRTLIKAADESLDSPDVEFSIEPIMRKFKRVDMIENKHTKLFNTFEYAFSLENEAEMSICKKKCTSIVVHPIFDITINLVVICNITVNIVLLREVEVPPHITPILYCIFAGIYISEMVIKMFVLSAGRRCNGIFNYFRCIWNTIDSILILITVLTLISELAGTHRNILLISSCIASIRIVRLARLMQFSKSFKFVFTYLTRRYENFVAYRAYEIGKTFIKGEQELMLVIPGMVNDTIITEEILTDIEKDIAIVTAELGMIQRNLPQVATNFKTKQAIRTILNSISEEINQIQVSGWIEELEYQLLMGTVYERHRFLRGLTNVEWSSPKSLFQEIPWLKDDPELMETLYTKVQIMNYAPKELVIVNDEVAKGVYLVLVGLLKVEYVPSRFVVDQLDTYGALPILDYITDTNFKGTRIDFIGCGNSFGELSILTGRPYSCNLIADSPCQIYFLNIADIKNAMIVDNDPASGLESRMWKAACSGLALHILTTASPYRSIPPDEVRLFLDRCFMPNLSKFSRFEKSNLIEDIVLIEGAILDEDSQEYYIAPRHLSRTVRRMALPGHTNYALNTTIEVKIIIISKANVRPEVIMEEIRSMNN
ncbi:hypothetical protein WA026_002031 [Henosepilachna vigintioctopunctata]